MAGEELDMSLFFLRFQLSLKSFFVDLLFELLQIGLFVRDFHVSQSFLFLFLELFAILIDLDCLLVKLLLFQSVHPLSSLFLLFLLPPPDIGLQLLDPLTIATCCIDQIVLKSSPLKIFRLEGP